MEKIHRRHGYQWVHPVHEVLEYSGTGEEKTVFVKGLVLNHYPDLHKSRSGYLPLLELSAKENPDDDRTVFWLGREYMYHKKYDLAIATLKKHLVLPTALWDEERSASMRFIAVCYMAKKDLKKAEVWLYRAIGECLHIREPYLQMTKLGYAEKNWLLVYTMCKKALSIKKSSGSYLVEPEGWGYALYDLGAIGAYNLGLYEEAYTLAKKALELKKDDNRLKNNKLLIGQKLLEVSGNV
jgi:tetratricopeptide (TPR) repeat protein